MHAAGDGALCVFVHSCRQHIARRHLSQYRLVMANHGMKVRLACGAAGNVGLHHVQDVLLQIC